MKKLAALVVSVLLGACADSHQLIKSNDSAAIRLNSTDAVFIAMPEDGVYGANTYQGSGQSTAQIIYSAFAKHTNLAKVARSAQSFDEALAATRTSGQKYLVLPSILHWEDRATEWSSIPDKVEVKIEIVDAKSGDSMVFAVVKGKSGLATFGGDHPQDLLPKPIEEFISSLY